MDYEALVQFLSTNKNLHGKIAHIEILPPKKGIFRNFDKILPERLSHLLKESGIHKLYSHQLKSYKLIKEGKNIVICTSSSSGKSLCFHLPVFEELLSNPASTALYIFSTKAVARDQLRKINEIRKIENNLPEFYIYDGDVPRDDRKSIRSKARVILTNPDMLHYTILPENIRWNKFFSNLKYIVIDEIHLYRGIFGTQSAHVFRRLERICNHYGSEPHYILGSSTIGNPKNHAERLTGKKFAVVNNDGAPKGKKYFLFWNPVRNKEIYLPDMNTNDETQKIFSFFITHNIKTILFAKSWISTELLCRHAKKTVAEINYAMAERIKAYRGGYLPAARREIENELFTGKLLGICTTNALETGIDIEGLDVCLILGYPGTISATWQQAGRVGRREIDSIVMLIAYNTPVNQYLMQHPDYFFSGKNENVLINPRNLYVLSDQLLCTAFELPLSTEEALGINKNSIPILNILQEEGRVKKVKNTYYYSGAIPPAKFVSLRNITRGSFTIMETGTDNVIGTIDEISAYPVLHPGAIYFYGDDSYKVEELDLEKRIAQVKKGNFNYYTNPLGGRGVRFIDSVEKKTELQKCAVSFGEVTAHFNTTAFRKIDMWTGEIKETKKLNLPPQELKTTAYWIEPDMSVIKWLLNEGINPVNPSRGLGHALMIMTSLFAQCFVLDVRDSYGWECKDPVSKYTLFIFDNYQGGLGYAEYTFSKINEVLEKTLEMIQSCCCKEGCPSCVGYHLRSHLRFDPKDAEGSMPDKKEVVLFLNGMLGKMPVEIKKKEKSEAPDSDSRELPDTVKTELKRKLLKNKFH